LLAVLRTGAAYAPLDLDHPPARLAAVLEDVRPVAVLTAGPAPVALPAELKVVDVLALRADGTGAAPAGPGPDDLAYVIHTSGSTGRPKGVAVAHRAAVNRLLWTQDRFGLGPGDRVLQKTSCAFDVSVWEFFWPLISGAALVLPAPGAQRDPARVAAAIDEAGITTAHFVPSMLVAYLGEPAAARPRALRRILCSGEALPTEAARRAEEVTGAEVFNLYGPTEAAIDVSWWPLRDGAPGATVPIGRAVWNTRLDVLDPWGAPVPPGEPGELYIAGDQLAVGYLGRPDLTAERFPEDPVAGRRYRTGDLVRRLPTGALEFLGRLDHQVKIRGFRVEPGEIEAVLTEHPEVAAAVVGTRDDRAGGPRLVAWVVPSPAGKDGEDGVEARARRWHDHLAARLPEHMVPTAVVPLTELPTTANGKLDRDALPEPPEPTAAAREPDGPEERALTEILAEVLGIERIGPDDDFFAAGGHSLTAARAATMIRARFGVEIGVADVFAARCAAGLAARLATAPPARTPLRPADRPERLPLSPAQRGLWFLDRLDDGPTYNIPLVLPLPNRVDADALAAALGDVVARHESLRTVFPAAAGVPYQEVREPAAVPLHVVDCPAEEIGAHVGAAARRRLDITREPGLRAGLYGPADGGRTLVLLLHHLVADGWSLRPLAEDLTSAYAARAAGRAPELASLPVQFADYVLWQHDRLDPAGAAARRDEKFWSTALRGLPEETALPFDRPRPARPTGRGGAVDLAVDPEAHAALRELARAHGVSLFTVLHAGVAALLTGLGAGTDLAIGTPVAGRHDQALDDVVGLVTNTVVLRTDTSGSLAVAELLARVQEADRAAWAHEDLPFEQVVELVNPPRVPGRHPLFTVMLALQNNAAAAVSLGGPPVPLRPSATDTAKFDLFFDITEHVGDDGSAPGGLTCHVEFARDLFEPDTARLLAEGLVAVLARAAADPGARLDDLVPDGLLAGRDSAPEALSDDAALESRVRALSAVADVAVTRPSDGGPVVWVVPARPGADDDARRLLAEEGGDGTPRVTAVTVLPRTAAGDLDVAALHRLPVVDDTAADGWRAALAAVPGVRAAAAGREDVPEELEALRPATRPRTAAATAGPAAVHGAGRALSLSEGPPLPPAAVDGWPEALRRAATGGDHAEIVHVRADGTESRRSYASLIEEADRVLGGLRALGLRAGDQVVLQCDDTEDFVAALWGAIAAGVTVVPLTVPPTYATDSAAVNKLDGVWRMLGRPVVVTSADRADGLAELAARREWPDPRVVTVDALRAAAPDRDWHQARPDDLLLMLLTSGSTGLPKAVRLTHGNVLSRAVAAAAANSLTEHDVSLNWIPLDHVTGVVMFHLRDVYLGARQVHAPTGWVLEDPLRWWELADRWRVSVTWAPNFAFGLVAEQAGRLAGREWDLSPVRLIMNAGEVVVGATNRRFLQALAPHGLPSDVMHPGWGMSETCSVVTDTVLDPQPPSGGDETFVSCGRPYPGFAMRVVDEELRLLPEGEVGRFQVRGASVTSGYHDNAAANAEAFTADGWFDTGDLAFLRDGELYITGRAKDVIIVNGVNHFSHEIEACVEELPVVVRSFTAAVAVRTDASAATDQLALFAHLAPGHDTGEAAAAALRAIRGKVAREVGVAPAHVLPVETAVIPKTEIGKIQRTQLRKRFEAGEFDAVARAAEVLLGTAATVPHWFLRPVWSPVARPATAPPAGTSVLIVAAGPRGALVAERLAALVRREGGRATTAVAGPGFGRRDAARYTVRPDEASDFTALLDRLAADDRRPDRVVHLGPLEPSGRDLDAGGVLDAQRSGAASVLALDRALAAPDHAGHAVDLRCVTGGDLPHATLAGLLPSLRDERPGLSAGTLAVPGDGEPDDVAALIAAELAVAPADAEVCRRDGGRRVRRLVPVPVPESVAVPAYGDGVVLVTGGLGGVAAHLAEHLLTTEPGVRLLLVGRTPLPAPDAGDPAPDDPRARAAAVLRRLRELGEVRYAAVDVTDEAALDAAVAAATDAWSTPLTGILHLAGTIERRAAADLDPAAWRAAIAAKVGGACVLDRLAARHPVRSFVSFSSVNGTFGAAFGAPYAAACAFLDALAVRQRARGLDAQSLAWSSWRDTGMSEGDELAALGETRGYRALDVESALRSFDLARGLDEPVVLIGADRTADGVRRLVDAPARPRHRLAARVELEEGADLGALYEAAVAAAARACG
ncbi:non-ribosomal peptide synthetase, partial [Streptomyces huiliensis]|uniref:non-ribosomal peptide synthetase n=1 Tax=Streptomyces huiliensis TaxID=2876027 RepID=UPI001CBE6A05